LPSRNLATILPHVHLTGFPPLFSLFFKGSSFAVFILLYDIDLRNTSLMIFSSSPLFLLSAFFKNRFGAILSVPS
jgi:hypothetical protein